MSKILENFDSFYKVIESSDVVNLKEIEKIDCHNFDLISKGKPCLVLVSHSDEKSVCKLKVEGRLRNQLPNFATISAKGWVFEDQRA
jgi:hypothetical protein